METLNEIYANSKYDDNTILIRILNTILEESDNENHYKTFINIKYYIKLLENLLNTSIQRNDIKFIVDRFNYLEANDTFNNFILLLKEVYTKNLSDDYKYLFLMCYCRCKFELFHNKYITYKKPVYALNEPSWSVFLDSLSNDDYIYS